jgi:hypothetical protein
VPAPPFTHIVFLPSGYLVILGVAKANRRERVSSRVHTTYAKSYHDYQSSLWNVFTEGMDPRLIEGDLRLTEGNVRLAEEELDHNTLGLKELQILEERKTIEWLREKIREERTVEGTRHEDGQE